MFEVVIRLHDGSELTGGSYEDEPAAKARAEELVGQLSGGGAWPLLDGRYVNPAAVVSIDLNVARGPRWGGSETRARWGEEN